jgi:hypothetical protein
MSDDQSKGLTPVVSRLPEPDDFGKVAARHARASAADILRRWVNLSIPERRQIATAFRSVMIPRRRAGRKPSETLTAAYIDWKSDIRGVALFQKHILNWERLSRWRRKTEQRSLMDAIYTRNRRERRKPSTTKSLGNLTP